MKTPPQPIEMRRDGFEIVSHRTAFSATFPGPETGRDWARSWTQISEALGCALRCWRLELARIAADTGFILHNELNQPDLTALFEHLGAETPVNRNELRGVGQWRTNGMDGRRSAAHRNIERPVHAAHEPGLHPVLTDVARYAAFQSAMRCGLRPVSCAA